MTKFTPRELTVAAELLEAARCMLIGEKIETTAMVSAERAQAKHRQDLSSLILRKSA